MLLSTISNFASRYLQLDGIDDDPMQQLIGCSVSYRIAVGPHQGKASAGQWIAVHGCGGVGLSAVKVANAVGANVIAIDIADDKLALAKELGAVATVNASGAIVSP